MLIMTFGLSLAHILLDSLQSQWMMGGGTMWWSANKLTNILTCEPQIVRSESGAKGPQLRQWPLAITACGSHSGASAAWPFGSTFQPEVLHKHFLQKPSLSSVCQMNAAKEPVDLRVHLESSVLNLSWNYYTVRKIFQSWSQMIDSSSAQRPIARDAHNWHAHRDMFTFDSFDIN